MHCQGTIFPFFSSRCHRHSGPPHESHRNCWTHWCSTSQIGPQPTVQYYFTKGLVPSTQRTYKSGKDRYVKFCQDASIPALPVSEPHLCSFIASLADQGLKYRTVKVYLSAIRHLQILAAQPDSFGGKPMSRLEYVLRGIKKNESEKGVGSRERLPITPSLLLRMKAKWEPSGGQGDAKMLWAACCLFFSHSCVWGR